LITECCFFAVEKTSIDRTENRDMMRVPHTFYEFFAGGGMARAGLGSSWHCLYANDVDPMKAATYTMNWGGDHVECRDISSIVASELPGHPDLAWASFPCQDLSLAGVYRGLGEEGAPVVTRSGIFWVFWSLMKRLREVGREPKIIVLENVPGILTSRGGEDFSAICNALASEGYRFGALVMDASSFIPQSRQRVFFVAVAQGLAIPHEVFAAGPNSVWHNRTLVSAADRTHEAARQKWVWWNMPAPEPRIGTFSDLILDHPPDVRWHTPEETLALITMMSSANLMKVATVRRLGRKVVGGVYKRTRVDNVGHRRQRAEVRFDNVAGCLRTPGGGSSRQIILVVDGDKIASRLLSAREAARLMGLPDTYQLPERYNDAYKVAGDGVCVPVVRHLAEHLIEVILGMNSAVEVMAATE
jgi:DNA (cytosine-5)-methyltransferase 1